MEFPDISRKAAEGLDFVIAAAGTNALTWRKQGFIDEHDIARVDEAIAWLRAVQSCAEKADQRSARAEVNALKRRLYSRSRKAK